MIAVNYQKAPEHKFTAFETVSPPRCSGPWQTPRLDIDPTRIGVGGDSAEASSGHGDRHPRRRAVRRCATSCWCTRSPTTPSTRFYLENAEGYLLQRATMQWF